MSSEIRAASTAKRSGASDGRATTACTCRPVSTSARSAPVESVPHQPAANAPGASHSDAHATSASSALRTNGLAKMEPILGPGAQAPEVRTVQEEDRDGRDDA